MPSPGLERRGLVLAEQDPKLSSEPVSVKESKDLAYRSAGATVTLISAIWFFHIQSMGFPDGHLTELDRAEITLFKVFSGLALPFVGYFVYCGRTHSSETGDKRFLTAAAAWTLITILCVAIEVYLGMHLEHGQGG